MKLSYCHQFALTAVESRHLVSAVKIISTPKPIDDYNFFFIRRQIELCAERGQNLFLKSVTKWLETENESTCLRFKPAIVEVAAITDKFYLLTIAHHG